MWSFRGVFLACLVVVGGCASGRGGGETGVGNVSGRVVDSRGVGVRGAVVTVISGDGETKLGSGTTDAWGDFVVEKVPAGAGRVVSVVKGGGRMGLGAVKEGVRVRGGGTADVGEMALRAAGR